MLIGSNGDNQGIVDISYAQNQANTEGLDLVEVNQNGVTPVCKIVDYNKYRYEQQKKIKKSKNQIKQLKISPRIGQHDLDVKIKHVTEWIHHNYKVFFSINFRGRENSHRELGYQILSGLKIPDAKISPPKLEGNLLTVVIEKC